VEICVPQSESHVKSSLNPCYSFSARAKRSCQDRDRDGWDESESLLVKSRKKGDITKTDLLSFPFILFCTLLSDLVRVFYFRL
jgi:hypothetical protein